jgi:hypothetical protein
VFVISTFIKCGLSDVKPGKQFVKGIFALFSVIDTRKEVDYGSMSTVPMQTVLAHDDHPISSIIELCLHKIVSITEPSTSGSPPPGDQY